MQGIVSTKQFESHLNTAINNNSQEFEFHHAYTGEGLLNAQRMARTINKLELLIYFVFPPHPRKFSLLNYSYWSLHFDWTETKSLLVSTQKSEGGEEEVADWIEKWNRWIDGSSPRPSWTGRRRGGGCRRSSQVQAVAGSPSSPSSPPDGPAVPVLDNQRV